MVKRSSQNPQNPELALLAAVSQLADEMAALRALLSDRGRVTCEYMTRHDIAALVGVEISTADKLIAQLKANGLGDGIARGRYPTPKVKKLLLELAK